MGWTFWWAQRWGSRITLEVRPVPIGVGMRGVMVGPAGELIENKLYKASNARSQSLYLSQKSVESCSSERIFTHEDELALQIQEHVCFFISLFSKELASQDTLDYSNTVSANE